MPYNTKVQRSVLIAKTSHQLLLKIMEHDKRGQQQALDYIIEQYAKHLGLNIHVPDTDD